MRFITTLALAMLFSSVVHADTAPINKVDFAGVPKGTKCTADAPNAKSVKSKTTCKEIRVKVRGDASGAKFFCVLPDGRQLHAILPPVPNGATGANLQIEADLTGFLYYDLGGIAYKAIPIAAEFKR